MFGIAKDYAIGESENCVGVCGLTSIDMTHRKAEFSFYIAPEYQGQGYASNALRALLKYAFDELGLNIVWGEVIDENPALALFERLGFKREGSCRERYFKEGKIWDSHMISVKKDEVVW